MSQEVENSLSTLIGSPLREIREEFVSVAEMQRKIMPEPNLILTFGDYDLYGGTIPIEWVGGDFHDFIDLSRFEIADRIGFVIADASGHGLSAAMLVRDFNTALYTGISFESHYAKDTTHLLFQKLNRRMYRSSLQNQFISAFYAELMKDGRMRYVNAGHLPPLVFRKSGHIEALESGGTVLGAFRDPPADYQAGQTRIDSGDLLIAYTDGVIETVNPSGEEFGLERLKRIVSDHRAASVRHIFDTVLEEVERFGSPRPQSDDRTLIVIRKKDS